MTCTVRFSATCEIAISRQSILSAPSPIRRTRACRRERQSAEQSRRTRLSTTFPMKAPGGRKPDFPRLAPTISDWCRLTRPRTSGLGPERFRFRPPAQQAAFLASPPPGVPLLALQQYIFLVGASSGIALNGSQPATFALLPFAPPGSGPQQFPTSCSALNPCALACRPLSCR